MNYSVGHSFIHSFIDGLIIDRLIIMMRRSFTLNTTAKRALNVLNIKRNDYSRQSGHLIYGASRLELIIEAAINSRNFSFQFDCGCSVRYGFFLFCDLLFIYYLFIYLLEY